jgi:hypothetical protein
LPQATPLLKVRRDCGAPSRLRQLLNKGCPVSPSRILGSVAIAGLVLVAGCQKNPLLVKRSPCPAVAVPTYTGDATLFTPGTQPDAANIDVVATITNIRDTCTESDAMLTTTVTYDVLARRNNPSGARTVSFPVFATIVQGGNLIVSKQVGAVQVDFADGASRATGKGQARADVARSATALPADIQAKITKKRKAGDFDAASDPMSDPAVKAALRAASFELLVGFQLSEAALAFNVTK